MTRVVALGLVLAGLLGAPVAALAGGAPGPSVLGIPHNGPSVLAVPYNGRPSVLAVPPRQEAPAVRHFHRHPAFAPAHRQPLWVQPQWWWNGGQWVWVPGYWTW
jgi:hypothetical protein